jgi:ligand-binding sensor domain-containing protein
LKTIYFGTTGGVLQYDRLRGEWSNPLNFSTGLTGGAVHLIAVDIQTLHPWFVTEKAVVRYNPLSFKFTHYTSIGDLSPGDIESIGMNPDGVWVEGKSRKIKYNRSKNIWVPVSVFPEDIRWKGEREADSLSSSQNRFLAPFTIRDKKFRDFSITAVEKDGKDLWVGTWGLGVFRYSTFSFLGEPVSYGLAHPDVETMVKENESIWFGGSGLSVWDREGNPSGWRHLDPDIFSQGVTDILFESNRADTGKSEEKIWIGTRDGLIRYHNKSGFWKVFRRNHGLPHKHVTALAQDGDALWIGTEKGLGNFALYGERIVPVEELKNVEILDIYVQPPDKGESLNPFVWVATSTGVLMFNKEERKWGIMEDPEGNTGFGVTAIEGDGKTIWFATFLSLLSFDIEKKRWDRYSSQLFLPNSYINDLEADNTNLWVGTDGGVAKYRKDDMTWKTYSTLDGLISNLVNDILIDGDYIFFATPVGVTKFYWNDPFVR